MDIEMIADYACHCGEGPLWHPAEKCVYWTDIPTGRLFRYDPATGGHACVMQDRPVGGYTLQADGSLLLFRDNGNIVLWRDGAVTATLINEVPEIRGSRFNDVCAAHCGGVYCGTMNGRYYWLAPDGALTLIRDGYRTPNGMGFSPDNAWLYYNDSGEKRQYRWNYDAATGAISDPVVMRDASAGDPGAPDGMCVDSEGCVWSARWDGCCLLRHRPDDFGVIGTIKFPVKKVTSVCFGGDALDTLYVTSAGGTNRDGADGPQAGGFFRVTNSGFTGLPRPPSNIKM